MYFDFNNELNLFTGWFVTYIDRDPETLALMEKKNKKEKLDKDDEERMMDFIQKQVEQGKQEGNSSKDTELAPLFRPEDDAPLVLEMKIKPKPKVLPLPLIKMDKKEDENEQTKSKRKNDKEEKDDKSLIKKKKVEIDSSSKIERGWLRKGIVVKVVTKSIGEKYYKSKGLVTELVDEDFFVGKIKLISPDDVKGQVIKIDQEHLETVIPGLGKDVLVLKGTHEGKVGIVKKVRFDDFCIDIQIKDDVVKKIPYENVCKIDDSFKNEQVL